MSVKFLTFMRQCFCVSPTKKKFLYLKELHFVKIPSVSENFS